MPPPAEELAARPFLTVALRTQSDRRLVTLVRQGYEVAFEEIVRRYGRALGRYAAGIVGGNSEDVTQDAFSKALLALRRNDAEIDLRPWLYRIVRNTALNDLRDRPPATVLLSEASGGGRGADEEAEQRLETAELLKRLRALPESQRAAIVMREMEGLSHEEIATALGLSGGAARQAIYRARQALRDGLGMLLPLPLLKLLLAGASGAAEATAGAGAGSAIGVGAVSAGAAGTGGALKLGVVAVVVAGTFGAGVVLHDASTHRPLQEAAEATSGGGEGSPRAALPPLASGTAAGRSRGPSQKSRHTEQQTRDESAAGSGRHGRQESGDDDGRPPGDGRLGGSGSTGHEDSSQGDPSGADGARPESSNRGPGGSTEATDSGSQGQSAQSLSDSSGSGSSGPSEGSSSGDGSSGDGGSLGVESSLEGSGDSSGDGSGSGTSSGPGDGSTSGTDGGLDTGWSAAETG